jgi:hypothetical protein
MRRVFQIDRELSTIFLEISKYRNTNKSEGFLDSKLDGSEDVASSIDNLVQCILAAKKKRAHAKF